MISLKNDFSFKCAKCGLIHTVESIKCELFGERSEQNDYKYILSDSVQCSSCKNEIRYRFEVEDDSSLMTKDILDGCVIETRPQFEFNDTGIVLDYERIPYDSRSIESIYSYAKRLEGMTFADIYIEHQNRHHAEIHLDELIKTNAKGLLGNFLEKYYFDYDINSDQRPDFAEVGVELKQTCIDRLKKGGYTAGERLSITNISYEEPVEYDFYKSHVWDKIRKILLVQYLRDKTLQSKLDYEIKFVNLFTPPEEDLRIIREDYQKIIHKIAEGKAHELSESDTLYLGAATKGKNANESTKPQYYGDHIPARKRNFSFKQSYMNYILKKYVLEDAVPFDHIISKEDINEEKTFEEIVLERLSAYRGSSDKDLCTAFDIEYTKANKSLWSNLAFRMLGVKSNKADEFEKANVVVKSIRVEEDNTIKESMSFPVIDFLALADETWESSYLFNYFTETRFLLVIYKRHDDEYKFINAKFWNMSQDDLETVRKGWTAIRDRIRDGVNFRIVGDKVYNDIPGMKDNSIIHMRPHTALSAYKLRNGFAKGNIEKDGCQLPDGQWMTKQCFWLNSDYILKLIADDLEEYN